MKISPIPHSPRILMVIALLLAMPVTARDYYVASNGSDDAPGSGAAPWRSIAKVNATGFQPGDRVLFRRGDRWAETLTPSSSGTAANPIIYADYGSGARPVISGASNDHCVSWLGSRSHLVFRNLHLKDCGQPSGGTRGAFAVWNDVAASRNVVLEDSILEGSQTWNIYLTGFDGLRIRRNIIRDAELQHGIYLDGTMGVNDVVIEENDIYGNADMCVQLNSNGKQRLTNVVLRYNRLHDCGAGGLNNIGADGLLAHHNLFYGAMPAIYNSCDGADTNCSRGAIGGVYANNTIVTSGSGWATCFSNLSQLGTPTFNSFINNICVQNAGNGAAFENAEATGQRVDYNLYFSNRAGQPSFVWGDREFSDIDSYRASTQQEANGLVANPEFVNPSEGNFELSPGSPAIDSGFYLGLNRDLKGRDVPSGEAPDRGAIEVASADGEQPPATEEPPATPTNLKIELR